MRAFRAALQKGRSHTRAKAWPAAIAAFDEALGHRPGDPGALAERGYARYLAGELEAAAGDLEAARERTQEPRRLGMIWFNVGLVADAAGNPEGARRAFTLSNQLSPTRAAAARLDGTAICTAEIDATHKPATTLASWRALHAHLAKETGSDGIDEPNTEAAARAALCHERDVGDVWDLCFYPSSEVNAHASVLAGRAPDGSLLVFHELAFAESGACQPRGELAVTTIGEYVHARYVELHDDWELVSTSPGNPDAAPCEVDGDDVPDTCEFVCKSFSASVDDYILDLRHKRQILHVRRTTHEVKGDGPRELEASLAASVIVGNDALALKGGGCDATLPFTAPAG